MRDGGSLMDSQIVLQITLKDGTTRAGTYTIYEALARLQEAARKPDFADFTFKDAK